MSLRAFLRRLIWLSMLPLLALAAYFIFDQTRDWQANRDSAASRLAHNVAAAIDHHLEAQIAALQMLAASSRLDDPPRLDELYREARNFQRISGGHVILADPSLRMILNTRGPLGEALPDLPRSRGRTAAPMALETGEPAVGDIVLGPVAKESLVAVAVPVKRDGQTKFLLLATFETRRFQQRLDEISLPSRWAIGLLDGTGEAIARRAPSGYEIRAAAEQDAKRFAVRSTVAPWSVVLDIPRHAYRASFLANAAALVAAILVATVIGVLGGSIAARRLTRAVTALTGPPGAPIPGSAIDEIENVRRKLAEAAAARAAAESTQRELDRHFRATFEQAAVGIAHVAPDGRWLRVNHKLCDIVGYAREELLTKTLQDITHPGDLAADLAYVRRLLAGEIKTYSMEKRYFRKDGAIVSIRLTVSLVRDATDKPDYFISVIEDITELKRVEAESEKSALQVQVAVKAGNVGLWDWDMDTNKVIFSPEWKSQIGYENHEIPGDYSEWETRLHPDDRDRTIEMLRAFLANPDKGYWVEFRLRHKDGSYRWILSQGSMLHDAQGKPARVMGCHVDITARKQAEEKLQASEQHLRAVLDNLFSFVGVLSPEGIVLEANRSATTAAGLRLEDVLGKPVAETYWFSYSEAVQERLRAAVREAARGKPVRYDATVRVAGGRLITLDFAIMPMFGPDGKVTHLIPSGIDITERTRAEEALRESEERFRGLVEQSVVGIYILQNDRISYANPRFAEILGYAPDELVGQFPESFVVPEDWSRRTAVRDALLGGERRAAAFNVRARRKDGSILDLEIHGTRVMLGGAAALLGVAQDVTERNRVEEQLALAQKRETVASLASGMVHDFNNILTLIQGHVELLELGLGRRSKPVAGILKTLRDATRQGVALTTRLLISASGRPVRPRSLDAAELIREIEPLLARVLGEGIKVKVVCGVGLWPVYADKEQLEICLINLTLNARDAMRRGGKVTIEARNLTTAAPPSAADPGVPPARYVRIAVSDTGIGMTPEVAKRAVEPFFTTKPEGAGTGLGLTMIEDFVRKSEGYLDIKSKQGQGTVVALYLRASDVSAAGESQASRVEPLSGKAETILVVEDDPAMRSLAAGWLGCLGYRTIETDNGPSALRLLGKNPEIRLVFSDVFLRGRMTGVQLAQKARKARPDLGILLVSGYVDRAKADMEKFEFRPPILEKPYTFEVLAREIGEALARTAEKRSIA